MLNLVRNENMKIYRRLRTLILIAILVGLTITVSIFVYKLSGSNNQVGSQDWKIQINQDMQRDRMLMQDNKLGFGKKQAEERLKVNEYRLGHNLAPQNYTLWNGVNAATSTLMIQLITIFTVIIAADIVAGEFATGTIKLLLIRPASRARILLSKYIATLIFSLLLLLILMITAVVLNGFLFGFGGIGIPNLYVGSDGVVHEGSMLLHVLGTSGLECVALVMIVTLAFMISTVFRSSSLSIALSLLIMFLGQGLAIFLNRYSWGKYFLFANTDLAQYLDGNPITPGMSMSFSILVLLAYFLLFNLLSWTLFVKRDVAA